MMSASYENAIFNLNLYSSVILVVFFHVVLESCMETVSGTSHSLDFNLNRNWIGWIMTMMMIIIIVDVNGMSKKVISVEIQKPDAG